MGGVNLRAMLLVGAVSAFGCDDPTPAGDGGMDASDGAVCLAAGAVVELGTGSDSAPMTYRALADGDGVYVVPGPQGGQHIWIGLRATGIDPSQPLVVLRAVAPSTGAVLGQVRLRLRMAPAPEDPSRYALSNQTLVLDDDRYCAVLDGGAVRVELELNDGAGHCVRASRAVRVQGIDPSAREIDRLARVACCTQRLPRCFPGATPFDAGARD